MPVAPRACRGCGQTFTPAHGRTAWCAEVPCQAHKADFQRRENAARERERKASHRGSRHPRKASVAAAARAVVLPDTPDHLGLSKPEPLARFGPELTAALDAARGVVEPGRQGVRRAVVALAHAAGRDETRERALAAAGELIAWAEKLRWAPPARDAG